jgi:hypothetical protein
MGRNVLQTGERGGRVHLPWGRAVEMCVSNVRHRLGRSALSFICIAVVVAFFALTMTYQEVQGQWLLSDDVHVRAVLEKAGVSALDERGLARQRQERIWLMSLSAFLCLVGVTNTILMSVTERYREIGTLKCLGMLDSFVIRLFLMENAFIGALASLAGTAAGCALAFLQLGAAFEFGLLSWPVCAGALLAAGPKAFGLGTLLALLASIYPTWVASRMKPVDAMRVEI